MDKLERQKALLAKLEGRLFRGSQLKAPPPRIPEGIDAFVSEAEQIKVPQRPGERTLELQRITNARGSFSFAMTPIVLNGMPTAQGVRFPKLSGYEPISTSVMAMLAKDDSLADMPLNSVAFIDCETTGLAGGTGTVAFLVGIGYFSGGLFIVEQYFMEDYDEEAAMIEALSERLRMFKALVSYNGKSYDIPLLRTRFIFHRKPPCFEKPHVDLLHPSRRFWRKRLSGCSLHTVESGVLNLRRLSDVPGFMIPQIYFDYVRGKYRGQMGPVFDHHAQDIVSLAALAGRISRMIESPLNEENVDAEDQIRLSMLFSEHGRTELAIKCLQSAVRRLRDPMKAYSLSMHLAKICKRYGRWDDARAIWQEQIEGGPRGRTEPYVELAKYYEHRAKDVVRAYEIVQGAIRRIDLRSEFVTYVEKEPNPDESLDELLHRLKRLEGRMSSR